MRFYRRNTLRIHIAPFLSLHWETLYIFTLPRAFHYTEKHFTYSHCPVPFITLRNTLHIHIAPCLSLHWETLCVFRLPRAFYYTENAINEQPKICWAIFTGHIRRAETRFSGVNLARKSYEVATATSMRTSIVSNWTFPSQEKLKYFRHGFDDLREFRRPDSARKF